MSRDTATPRQQGSAGAASARLQPPGEPATQQQIACGNSSTLLRFMTARFSTGCQVSQWAANSAGRSFGHVGLRHRTIEH